MAAVAGPVGIAAAVAAVVDIVQGGPAVAAVQVEFGLELHVGPLHKY